MSEEICDSSVGDQPFNNTKDLPDSLNDDKKIDKLKSKYSERICVF